MSGFGQSEGGGKKSRELVIGMRLNVDCRYYVSGQRGQNDRRDGGAIRDQNSFSG